MTFFSMGGLILAAVVGAAAPSDRLLALLAQGKTETDLGHYDIAAKALGEVAAAPDATPALRSEALIRLGAARRAAGDLEGAVQAFEHAAKDPWVDERFDTKALLVQALGGALPGPERWSRIQRRVGFTVDRSDPSRPTLAIAWPDVPPSRHVYRGEPTTLRFDGTSLQEICRRIADISGLNVVVFPGVPETPMTFHSVNEPWDRSLDQILAASGLAYRWEGSVLSIGTPDQVGTARAGAGADRATQYAGEPIEVDFKDASLRSVLERTVEIGGATAAFDPSVSGSVTIKLTGVRWDQAFDVIVRTNGLEWMRSGNVFTVGRPGIRVLRPETIPPSSLDELSISQVSLRGIVRDKVGYSAMLEGAGGAEVRPVYFAKPGGRLHDGEVVGVDASTVTFRSDVDRRETRKGLYESEGAH